MEPLLLSWMFDKRWLWGVANPCMEFVLLVPLAANLATIGAMLLERTSSYCWWPIACWAR
jgi:hypothetical protein